MTVGDLAVALGLTAGRVLDACEVLGIDADGRSTALSDDDVASLRAALTSQGTRRDTPESATPPSQQGGGTRRDGAGSRTGTRGDGTPDAAGWGLQLPAVLDARFRLIRQLRHGGEGFVVLVEDRNSAERLVLKGYHLGFDLDPTSLEVLSRDDIDLDHVVKIHYHGTLPDGAFYEVQEYCADGSLRELMLADGDIDLDRVIAELVAAVAYVHSLGIVHRDIKPENILVRTVEPLDLVITDFGLVRHLQGSVRRTTRAGTAEYSPPEGVADNVDISPAWDWWSLGMVIAELAGGTHPLALPDGSFPSPDAMRSELAQRPVPLDAITDPRLQLLCSGLLVRDRLQRWTDQQVTQWAAGESPTVTDNQTAPSVSAPATVLFADREHTSVAELARSFQDNWSEALLRLYQDPDPGLIEEATTLCRVSGNDQAASLLGEKPAGEAVVRHLTRLLAEMDPQLPPRFDGVPVTPAGLEAAAAEVFNRGNDGLADRLQTIERAQVLRAWRHLPGMTEAVPVSERWKALRDRAEPIVPANVKNDLPTRNRLAAALLLAALDDRHVTDLTARLRAEEGFAPEVTWWQGLYGRNDEVATLVAIAAQPLAHAEGAAIRERRRQEEEEQRAQRRREHQAQEAARRSDDLQIWKPVLILASCGLPVGIYRVVQETHGYAAPMNSIGALADADFLAIARASLIGGLFIGPAIGAVILVLRGNWSIRRFGLGLAGLLAVVALVAFAVGGNAVADGVEDARDEMRTTPLPESRFETCGSRDVFSSPSAYWTGTTRPTRTFIDTDCRTVRSYSGWLENWSWRAGGLLGGIASVDGYYVVLSQNAISMTGLDPDDGTKLWTQQCDEGYELDELQFDRGEDTLDNQRLVGTCGPFAFSVDPSTGRA